MNQGKQKCELLKAIRKQIAEQYGLDYNPSECSHEGECSGTCPQCDAELKELQGQLDSLGRKDIELNKDILSQLDAFEKNDEEDDVHVLEGDVTPPNDDELMTVTMGMPAPPYTEFKKKRVLYKECQIAGIGFRDLKDVWDELYEGAELALVRQKKNKYDKNAIAVALADDYDGDPEDFDFDFILGYVPRTENEHLATMIDMGWAEAFECELSQIHGSNPYKGSLYMRIYIVSKDETEDTNSHLLRVMELDKESFDSIMSSLATEGCCYFRWGGFPPWERTLPIEGNKVVFMNKQETDTILYLMHCIAVGDDKAASLVKDWERYVDDSCYYVFTNIKGPIIVRNEDIEFLNGKTNDNCQPESILDEEDTLKLRSLFE